MLLNELSLSTINAPFPAKILGSAGTTPILYSWQEMLIDPSTGALAVADPGRRGSTTVNAAQEINNQFVATNSLVWMRLRGTQSDQPVWEFNAGQVIPVIEVKDVSGTPDYTSIGIVETDAVQGLYWTNPGTGIAQLGLYTATPTQIGSMDVADQAFNGAKWFQQGVYIGVPGGSFTPTTKYIEGLPPTTAGGQISIVVDSAPSPQIKGVWTYSVTNAYSSGGEMTFQTPYAEVELVENYPTANDSAFILSSGIGSSHPCFGVKATATLTMGVWGAMPDGSNVSGGLITHIGSGIVASGVGPPSPSIGIIGSVYFDVTDPSNPTFYYKT